MNLTNIPQRNPDIAYEKVGEESILLSLTSGAHYTLNDTGTMFWDLIDGKRTIAVCAAEIAIEYNAVPEIVEADLLELAVEFKSEKLIDILGT